MAASFAQSESELAVGAAKRKRKRRRSPGGLGRGLARILTDTQIPAEASTPRRSGLLQLVGGESNAKAERIRRFVVDAALGTMVDGFALDGILLAAQGSVLTAPGSVLTAPGSVLTAPGAGGVGSRQDGPRRAESHPGGPQLFDPGQFDPAQFDPAQFDPAQFDPAQFDPAQFDPARFDSGPTSSGPGRPDAASTAGDPLIETGKPTAAGRCENGVAELPSAEAVTGFFAGHDRRDDDGPMLLAAKLATSWPMQSSLPCEVYVRVKQLLGQALTTDEPPTGMGPADLVGSQEQWQIQIGDHWVLLARIDDGGAPVTAVAIRRVPFSPQEAEFLGAMVASVVAAGSDGAARTVARQLIRAGTTASLKSEGPDVLAEVNADWELPSEDPTATAPAGGRRTGVGRDPDPISAVARAAAKACRPRCEVVFAGSSQVEDAEVSIVMIRPAKQGLRLGYAVRPKGDYTGAAEAVFTAAG